MQTVKKFDGVVCPNCGNADNQIKHGFTRAGSQRYKCKVCGKLYTPTPKPHSYPQEVRQQAIKLHFSGMSGRAIGKMLHIHRANTARWLKKTGSQAVADSTD